MERINEIFFSNHGLTSTSAAHLADLAQELIAGNEAKLKNLNFVTTKVDIVGSTAKLHVEPRCRYQYESENRTSHGQVG